MSDTPELDPIIAYLKAIHPQGPWNIGVLSTGSSGLPSRAFRDVNLAAQFAHEQSEKLTTRSVYVNQHHCSEKIFSKETFADSDVDFFTHLTADIDRREHGKENASDAELAVIQLAAQHVKTRLRDLAECAPMETFSGNGRGLVFKIAALENTPENARLFKDAVAGMCDSLNKELEERGWNAQVDAQLNNAGRWNRCPGTANRKFPETEGRPHRVAEFLNPDGIFREACAEFLQKLAALRVTAKMTPGSGKNSPSLDANFKIEDLIAHYGLTVASTRRSAGLMAYNLTRCPLGPTDSGPECRPAFILGDTLGWKCHHPDCADKTIGDVLRKLDETHPKYPKNIWVSSKASVEFKARKVSEIKAEKIAWLLEGLLPKGMLATLFAAKGRGKTKICDWITAEVNKVGGVVLRFNLEDPEAQVLKPGIVAADCVDDLTYVIEREAILTKDGKSLPTGIAFSDPLHVEALRRLIKETSAVLVILEPMNNYKGRGVKSVSEDDMRPIYSALAEVAHDTGCAIIAVNHENRRNETGDPLDKQYGAGSSSAVARVNLTVRKNLHDEPERWLMNAGSNLPLGPTKVFRIVDHEPFVLDDVTLEKIGYAKFIRNDETLDAQTVIDEERTTRKSDAKDIEKFLRDYLDGKGQVPSDQVVAAAQKHERKWSEANIRQTFSRKKIGAAVQVIKGKERRWDWTLAPGLLDDSERY